MASRMMHYAVNTELAKRLELKDKTRFLAGGIIPDAGEKQNRWRTHFYKVFPNGYRTYDLSEFLAKYGKSIGEDDFYLGYYCHLVQDLVFRLYIIDRSFKIGLLQNVGTVLYYEYNAINGMLVQEYRLDELQYDWQELEKTKICQDMDLDLKEFSKEFHTDFLPKETFDKGIFLLDQHKVYIEQAVEACCAELKALHNGTRNIDERKLAWPEEKAF